MRGPWGRGAELGAGVLGGWEGVEKMEKTQEQRQILGNVLKKKASKKAALIGQEG